MMDMETGWIEHAVLTIRLKANEAASLGALRDGCFVALSEYPEDEDYDAALMADSRMFASLSRNQRMAVKLRRNAVRYQLSVVSYQLSDKVSTASIVSIVSTVSAVSTVSTVSIVRTVSIVSIESLRVYGKYRKFG